MAIRHLCLQNFLLEKSHSVLINRGKMLHLGVGSFHRAHQAFYMQRVHELNSDTAVSWPLMGGNIRSDMVTNEMILRKQKCRYTLETINSAGVHEYNVIRSISEIVEWSSQLNGLVAVGKNPKTKIISFTVTEGGYYLNSTTDTLNTNDQDIKNDIMQLKSLVKKEESECKPISIYGALGLILFHRCIENSDSPVTLMSCDNVRHNGECHHIFNVPAV